MIACAACGAEVNEKALRCPACGSDPRTGAPGPFSGKSVADDIGSQTRLTLAEHALASGALPDTDRRRVRRLRLVIAALALAALLASGALGFVWFPGFLAAHVAWDNVTHSRNGRWQERDVSFGGFGPDSIGTSWVEVRGAGTSRWRSAYLDTSGEVAWKGDLLQITQDNNDPSAPSVVVTIDPQRAEHGGLLIGVDPSGPIALLLIEIAIGAWLIVRLPRLLARRRVKALVRAALTSLEEGDGDRLAGLCLGAGAQPGRRELALRLAQCHGVQLVSGRRRRLASLERRESLVPSAWLVRVRIFGRRSEPQWIARLLVASTADAWLLVPDFGLLAPSPVASDAVPWSRRPNGGTVAALVLGLVACAVSAVPFVGVLGVAVGLLAVVLSVNGFHALRCRGGPAYMAGIALGISCVALLVAVGQAVFVWIVFMLPTTTSFW